MHLRFLFLSIFSLFLSIACSGQTQQQWLKHAQQSFEEKDYYGASLYYRQAMLVDSSNLVVVYKYAECLRLTNNYKLAEHYYNYVYTDDRGRTFPENLFWLATMQKNNAKYLEARKSFMTFNKSYRDKSSFYYKKSAQEGKSCEFALQLIKSPTKASVNNLGDSLNTINAEFAAVPLNDSVFYFSSLQYQYLLDKKSVKDKQKHTAIYKAERSDTLWVKKEEVDTTVNLSSAHNANGSLSPDKKTYFFTRCGSETNCKIYVSKLDSHKFSHAQELASPINIDGFTNTQPFITTIDSSEVLFFVSDRPGSKGGLDIWYSTKQNNQFTTPVNAGPEINTIEDDLSPFYLADSSLLYFSSPWHYGLGGWDVFKSKGKPGAFEKASNLGYPINSSVNDLYFSINSRNEGFLTSNRIGSITKENETCCNDIWGFKIPIEKPKRDSIIPKKDPLKDLITLLPIKLYFHNDEPNPRTTDTISTISYTQSYNEYKLLIPDYKEHYSKGLDEKESQIAKDTIEYFFKNYVDRNYNVLEEFTAMLLRQMEKGYNLEVAVKGHASPLARSDYNVHLTSRRISSLENYLSEYKDGVFKPYLIDSAQNGGSLKIVKIPFGEYKAEHFISDNLNDKKSSVYSIDAALNRNIEIISVSLEDKDSLTSRISFRKEVYDFNELKSGVTVSHTFRFKNTGKAPLLITGSESECTCLTAELPSSPTAPGEMGTIKLTFNSTDLKGKMVKSITLFTNGIPTRKELSITAEIK